MDRAGERPDDPRPGEPHRPPHEWLHGLAIRYYGGEPGTPTFLIEYVNTPEEISVSVDSGVLVLGALLGLVYSFARSYLRVRTPSIAGD